LLGVWLGIGGHAQVGAQHVDAHLAATFPVVSEGCKSMHAREANRRSVGAEFVGGLVEALGVELGVLPPGCLQG
jgi:hypothetical protein